MKSLRLLTRIVLGAATFVLAGCSSKNGEPGGAAGAAGASGASGLGGTAGSDSGIPWDSEWHQTQPKSWDTIGPESNPSCGPGCRIALNLPLAYKAAYGHAYSTAGVLDAVVPTGSAHTGLAFAGIGDPVTRIMPAVEGDLLEAHRAGDFVSYLRNFGVGKGRVEIASLSTGETKVAFSYTPAEVGTNSVERTILGPNHVYWVMSGIWARNLASGETKRIADGACWSYCATESLLVCESGGIYVIDVAEPKDGVDPVRLLDPLATEFQTDGNCSPDRKQYAWVDYRDPPGPGSTNFFARSGGEIYIHDFAQNETKRVTFDSPVAPRGKLFPAIGGDIVVWNEPPLSSANPNPEDYQSLDAESTALAKLDLVTGERCQLDVKPAQIGGFKSVHGHHVYGWWFDNDAVQVRLVDIDLDHPELDWKCTPE